MAEPEFYRLPFEQGLTKKVRLEYPHPIALAFSRLLKASSQSEKFQCLIRTFESLVHYLATVAVSAYFRTGLTNADCNRVLLDAFRKSNWGAGDYCRLLSETLRLAGDCEGHLPYKELRAHFFEDGKPTKSYQALERLVQARNDHAAHGGGGTEDYCASKLPLCAPLLAQELANMPWLVSWQLIRPIQIDQNGSIAQADVLMGDIPEKNEPYELLVKRDDLYSHGGEVVETAETSLLLVAPDRARYLPLFPLSLFLYRVTPRFDAVYFLQKVSWNNKKTQLNKAVYVSYLSEAKEDKHNEERNYPALNSLQKRVQQLEAVVGASPSAPSPPVTEPAEEDPDYRLPEVDCEQQFHLRTFAGRQDWLQRIAAWIDGEEKGGYLLLVAPPGQGKSALMAELARRQSKIHGRAVLLHMMKSCRDPLKFMPAILTQSAELAKTRFGRDAYRGTVDELCSSLFNGLIAVTKKRGRAVLLIDALDELDGRESISFLPKLLPEGIRVVLTCRPDIALVRALRARLQACEEWKLPPLSEADMRLFVERRLDEALATRLIGAVDWTGLFQRSEGNPLLLHRYLNHLIDVVKAAPDDAPLPDLGLNALPATPDELFESVYEDLCEKRRGQSTPAGQRRARLLQLMCLEREPLSVEQLSQLMAADGRPLSMEECRDHLFAMSAYLLDVGDNHFKPWHQGLTDLVVKRILGENGCLQTEQTFCAWLESPAAKDSGYFLRHSVSHSAAAKRVDATCRQLTDPSYLQRKAEAGLVFELDREFSNASASLETEDPRRKDIEARRDALRKIVHDVDKNPTLDWWKSVALQSAVVAGYSAFFGGAGVLVAAFFVVFIAGIWAAGDICYSVAHLGSHLLLKSQGSATWTSTAVELLAVEDAHPLAIKMIFATLIGIFLFAWDRRKNREGKSREDEFPFGPMILWLGVYALKEAWSHGWPF
jgi:hypothetical protein